MLNLDSGLAYVREIRWQGSCNGSSIENDAAFRFISMAEIKMMENIKF